ncbi:MAG: hypothetical protein KAH56_12405 [Candidatus Krumholzibacteria bacterium]|nr:hypothetical protein [Candidatus Krumholzibacteria bacterium]
MTIDVARELTRRLQDALETQDMQTCRDLLEFRYQAMVDFECAHRAASDQEREKHQRKMAELHTADGELLKQSEDILARVASEFREQLGLPTNGQPPAGRDPLQACLDRKA